MIKQGTAEWLAQRVGRVTGSSAAAILGLSPWQSREDVMRRMVREVHGAPSEMEETAPMKWGTAMEATARADYEMDSGNEAHDAPFVPYENWLGASPDALIGDDGVLEIKAPYGIRNDNPPAFKSLADQPHYGVQCQIEMFVTDRRWLDFYQWTPFGQRLERIERDDDWLSTNIPRLKQFWAELQDAIAEPEEHLAPKRQIIDTPQAHAMIREYDELVEQEERVKERKKDLLAEMTAMAGDKDALFGGRKLTKVEKEGAISYAKAIRELAPDADLEQWRGKASEYWRLS